jgi:hypothetical protein
MAEPEQKDKPKGIEFYGGYEVYSENRNRPHPCFSFYPASEISLADVGWGTAGEPTTEDTI